MKFEDWSLKRKLGLNFVLNCVVFCLMLGASLGGFNVVKKQFDEVATDSVPDIIAILELKSVSKRLFAEIQGFIASGELDEIEEFNESVELFDQWLERWDIYQGDSLELGLKQEMIAHKQAFEQIAEKLFGLANTQQQLIERFEGLFERQHAFIENSNIDRVTSLKLSNQFNYFYRLTYLSMLLNVEEDDDDHDEQQAQTQAQPQEDHANEDELDERLENAAQLLLLTTEELSETLDTRLVSEIKDLGFELVEITEQISEELELVEDYEEEILETLDRAVALQNSEVDQAFQSVNITVGNYVLFVIFVGIAGLVLGLLIFKLIRNVVSERLGELLRSTQRIADGDLEHETKIIGQDEFGQLSQQFNQMTHSLRQTTVSKEFVDNLLASMTESLVVVSPKGIIEVVNDETIKATGYQRGELIGQPFSILLANDESFVQQVTSNDHEQYRSECFYVSKTGEQLPVLLSSSHLYNRDGEELGVICVATNVQLLKQVQAKLEQSNLELKTAQTQLIQASKLASIGELSAGVAHELNQPLTIIRNGGQLIERRRLKGTLDDEKLTKFVDSVLSNSKRMMKIIDHLRTFSRHSSTQFIEVDVNEVVNNSLLMVGEQLKLRGVSVTIQLSDVPVVIKGEPNQLEQVLLNFISNARDAMVSSARESKQLSLATRLLEHEPAVEIEVSDNGGGISQDAQARIFDPFYTTKEEGKGTGLGLSISYGIITDHKGTIEVVSSLQSGTSMRVRLPSIQPTSLDD